MHARGKSCNCLIGGRGRHRAGLDAKARAVARADDFIAFHFGVGQRRVIVGADVFDGVELAVQIEHRDLHIIHVDDATFTRREFFQFGDINPL